MITVVAEHGVCRAVCLETVVRCGDVLLVDGRGHTFKPIEPGDALHVVAVGPKGVEHLIGTGGNVAVVADL